MLDNGFAETNIIAPGVKPPARVIHPKLGIGENPVKHTGTTASGLNMYFNLVMFKWKCTKYKTEMQNILKSLIAKYH